MRPLRRMIVSLLVLPVSAAAQSPTSADLVGTWVWSSGVQFKVDTLLVVERYFTFADSTFKQGTIVNKFAKSSAAGSWVPVENAKDEDEDEERSSRWRLQNGTLTVGRGRRAAFSGITLQGQQIKAQVVGGKCEVTLRRRDLAKPAITLPPATFKRADLAGTWVLDSLRANEKPDTLWLKADGTLRYFGPRSFPNEIKDSVVSGTNWDVAPGDYLYLPYKYPKPIAEQTQMLPLDPAVVHEGNQPVIVTNHSPCSNSPDERKYKRVSP